MNTRLVNAVADVIARSRANGKKTPAGWAMDLESAQLVQSPETAAEMERLVKERDAFRDQRNAVFATNEQLHARVEASGLARIEAENETRTANRELKALRARVAELEAQQEADHKTWQHDLRTARSEREATDVRIAELEQRPSVEDVASWLVKKAREYSAVPKSRQESAADWLVRLASKVMRGAIRPGADQSADRLTRLLAPTQALRETDGEHYAAVHHDYRQGRDLPETGGQP